MNNTPIFDKIKRNDEEKPHLSPLIAANLRAACHNELCSISCSFSLPINILYCFLAKKVQIECNQACLNCQDAAFLYKEIHKTA